VDQRPTARGSPPDLLGRLHDQRELGDLLVAGERVALDGRADRCNLFAGPDATGPATVAAKLDVLRAHCAREGTDYEHIDKTVLYAAPLAPGADAAATFAEAMTAYAAVGVTEVHVMPMDGDPVGFVRNLGEHVIPQVASL
jgi:hypothetical protein